MKHRKEFLRTCRFDFLLYKILMFHVKQGRFMKRNTKSNVSHETLSQTDI